MTRGLTPGSATVVSVAQLAGVSRQTVSNVLHNPEVVHPDTRDRVLAAIEQLDYRPNLAARQMRTRRSQAIAVRILPSEDGINAVVLDRFVHALCRAAERQSHHVVVFTARDDADEIGAYARVRSTLSIDGFVVTGTHAGDERVEWLSRAGLPFVAFGRPWSDGAEHSWVDVDGAAGTRAATEHLLSRGHTEIAFLGWSDSIGTGDDREAGWRAAMDQHRPPRHGDASARIVLRGTDSVHDGAVMVDRLRSTHPEVTAAVCVSDSIAIGAVQAATATAHPIELVGFDNTAAAHALGLPSVAQPLEEIAERCFGELHRQIITDQREPHAHVLLSPRLHLRTSSSLSMSSPTPTPTPPKGL